VKPIVFKAFLTAVASLLVGGCSEQQEVVTTPAPNTPIANVPPVAAKPVPAVPASVPIGSGFEFYVLALSWSPAYCELEGRSADPAQCSAAKPFRFIVHGLWPQNERGYPQNCGGDRLPGREDIRSMIDLTPSPGLLRYQWDKHGSCSGLDPRAYYAVMRAAHQKMVIPAQFNGGRSFALAPQEVETAFARANPGLSASAMATICEDGLLTEVRICFTKSLEFRSCPEVDRRSCRAKSVTIEAP
jgi:ribonuclease T2